MLFRRLIILSCCFLISYIQANEDRLVWDGDNTNFLAPVFYDDDAELLLTNFMNNVLRQYPAEQFITQGRRLVDALGQVDNKTFYPALKIEVDREKSLFHFYKQVQSLRNQQAIIGQQLDSLIGQEPVENYLEIGTQGTYIN